MKKPISHVSRLLILVLLAALAFGALPAFAQDTTPPDPDAGGTPTVIASEDTETPADGSPPPQVSDTPVTPTETRMPTVRPVVLVDGYGLDVDTVYPGKEFSIVLKLANAGGANAINVVASFTPGDLIPNQTGGSVSVSRLQPGETREVRQPFIASTALAYGSVAQVGVSVTYYDDEGMTYSGTFSLAVRVGAYTGGAAGPTKTPTPVEVIRPQLVISEYTSDVSPLQPGTPFTLNLTVRNLGNADAKAVTMVLGGGASSGGGNPSGTPQPGGVSGASGDFANFAPLGSSNIVFLGDMSQGTVSSTSQKLIVNTSLNPGAYSVKFAFVYSDDKGNEYVDDQVISLLIYKLPQVEVSFYRQADPLFTGQPGMLPIQIVNLGRSSTVLGNMTASAEGAELTNNTILVGALDPGGYYPLDVNIVPSKAGPLEIKIKVSFTDDFNQPQVIERTLEVDVQEGGAMGPGMMPGDGTQVYPGDQGPGMIPGMENGMPPAGPETFWQKALRFIKGLIGLDSAPPTQGGPGIEMPVEGMPSEGPVVVPEAPRKGG